MAFPSGSDACTAPARPPHVPEEAVIRDPVDLVASLRWPVRLTFAGLWVERALQAFWPLLTGALLLAALFLFDAQRGLTGAELRAAFAGAGLLALATLAFGLWRFRRPRRVDALARLDASLPGQPIAALADVQAIGITDPASRAVWEVHRARMARRAEAAGAVAPDLRLSGRDPFALRYVGATAFVMALIFGGWWQGGGSGLLGAADAAQKASGPAWEAWAQPPAYTGRPTLYLADIAGNRLEVPVGTRVQIRLYGTPEDLSVVETVTDPAASAAAADPALTPAGSMDGMAGTTLLSVARSGTLEITGEGGRVWEVIALPDARPEVTPKGEMGREADGRMKQEFSAKDDYAVVGGQVSIALDLGKVERRHGLVIDPEPREAVILDLPMPIRGTREDFTETLIDDLSEHPFANLPVTLVYSVIDEAGQEGTAAPIATILPGRRFFDPVAAAIIEMRRDLLWNRANAPRTATILRAITHAPDGLFRTEAAALRLRVALREIDSLGPGMADEDRDRLAAELWDIALLIEVGDLNSARERLERAQDRLAEAMRNGASPEEIDELMREMREAMDDYMRELAERSPENPNGPQPENGQTMELTQDDLQRMLDEIQRLMEEGRMAEAAELMEQLQQMLENMQVTEGEGGQGGPGGPGQQAMRDLSETLRDQQDLSDDSFRDMQEGNGQQGEGQQGEGQQGGGQQGENGQNGDRGFDPNGRGGTGDRGEGEGSGGDRRSLAERQGELEGRLQDLLNRRLPGDGSEEGEAGRRALDEARRAMRDAERNLEEGDLDGALDRQADAMEAMREGLQNFGEAMAQEQRERQDGAQEGEDFGRADPNGRDPLGREPGDAMRLGSDRNMVQDEDTYRRAQELLDEIRRRSGELARPDAERDYLKRLLEQF